MSGRTFDEIISEDRVIQDLKEQLDSDGGLVWNMIQVRAALLLVHHFFGDKWYRLALASPTPPEEDNWRLQKYLRDTRTESHPLNVSLWSGDPENLVKLLQLGASLKVLGFDHPESDLKSRIRALRSAEFSKAYFELKVAATYASAGFSVQFLRTRKNKHTPEMLVTEEGGASSFVECKKRDPKGGKSIAARASGVLDRFREANLQFKHADGAGIAWVEVEDGLTYDHPDVVTYMEYVQGEMRFLQNTQCAVITSVIVETKGNMIHHRTMAKGIANPHVAPTAPREVWCNANEIGDALPKCLVEVPGAPYSPAANP